MTEEKNKDIVKIREATLEDKKYLVQWLSDEKILAWFPMCNAREIEDAARLWIGYAKYGAALTAEIDGVPCGNCLIYLPAYKRISKQCLLAIIVDKNYRNKGIGTKLIREIEKRAKEKFNIKNLHLEVYEGNPAHSLYKRMGFVKYGYQKNFIKELDGNYRGKIMMQKILY
jgi:GNAT superfamily N-acetyltransferase